MMPGHGLRVRRPPQPERMDANAQVRKLENNARLPLKLKEEGGRGLPGGGGGQKYRPPCREKQPRRRLCEHRQA